MGSLGGWYLTVRRGLGERAGGGGGSIGVQAGAQLENLCQAHILLGCPVGGGRAGREQVNRIQPGTCHPHSMPKGHHSIQYKIHSRGAWGAQLPTVASAGCRAVGWGAEKGRQN